MTGNEMRMILQPMYGYGKGWQKKAAMALHISYPHLNKMINNKHHITERMEFDVINLSKISRESIFNQ